MPLHPPPEELDSLAEPIYGPYVYARSLLTPTSRVLDVGCGNGKVSEYLASSGATVDGIEPDSGRSTIAASRVRHLSTVPAGEDDPALLPAYDLITFFDVIEHFAEPGRVLDWATSILAPKGRIVASIPNSAHYSFRLKILRGDWSMDDWGLFDRTHLRFFDPDTMTELVPRGTQETDRKYFTPASSQRRLALLWPRMFALHIVIVWRNAA